MPDDTPDDSILVSVKKQLGLDADYDAFDLDIINNINAVFSDLFQLKIGPTTETTTTVTDPETGIATTTTTYTEHEFSIEDASTGWSEFLVGMMNMERVKTYMYMRVRLMFDPPQTSFGLENLQKQVEKMEWRMNVQAESRV